MVMSSEFKSYRSTTRKVHRVYLGQTCLIDRCLKLSNSAAQVVAYLPPTLLPFFAEYALSVFKQLVRRRQLLNVARGCIS